MFEMTVSKMKWTFIVLSGAKISTYFLAMLFYALDMQIWPLFVAWMVFAILRLLLKDTHIAKKYGDESTKYNVRKKIDYFQDLAFDLRVVLIDSGHASLDSLQQISLEVKKLSGCDQEHKDILSGKLDPVGLVNKDQLLDRVRRNRIDSIGRLKLLYEYQLLEYEGRRLYMLLGEMSG